MGSFRIFWEFLRFFEILWDSLLFTVGFSGALWDSLGVHTDFGVVMDSWRIAFVFWMILSVIL